MVDTLLHDDLRPAIAEQADALLEMVDGADAAAVERAVCLAVLGMPGDLGALVVETLATRGRAAAAPLAAAAKLGPPATASAAADALVRLEGDAPIRVPAGIGELRVTDLLGIG